MQLLSRLARVYVCTNALSISTFLDISNIELARRQANCKVERLEVMTRIRISDSESDHQDASSNAALPPSQSTCLISFRLPFILGL